MLFFKHKQPTKETPIDLPTYKSVKQCPKCGADRSGHVSLSNPSYPAATTKYWWEGSQIEHMRICCGRCNYIWREKPLNDDPR